MTRGITGRPLVAALAVIVLTSCGDSGRSQESPVRDCNVVLISIDTLRADHLGSYGHTRPTSPHLDRLAEDGVLFERFHHNGGFTLPSHLSMMTSLRPDAHGVTAANGRVLGSSRITLAEQLREAGFVTAAFADAGWLRGKLGFAQGFDLYDDAGGRFEQIMPKAIDWLDLNSDRRFFLFLHTYDVHSQWRTLPYDCPGDAELRFASEMDIDFDGCRGELCASRFLLWANEEVRSGRATADQILTTELINTLSALYDGCLFYVDEQIGGLINHLKSLGIYDRSLVIVTSDHGEEFADHGMFLHAQFGYEEISHLPLIIKFPHSWSAGTRVHHMAAMVDVMPTVLDITGISVNSQAQGHSLLPTIVDDVEIRTTTYMRGIIRTSDWKYFSGPRKLYNLATDPLETTNLSSRELDKSDSLAALIADEIEKDKRLQSVDNPRAPLSATEIEELEKLGYVVGGPADGR